MTYHAHFRWRASAPVEDDRRRRARPWRLVVYYVGGWTLDNLPSWPDEAGTCTSWPAEVGTHVLAPAWDGRYASAPAETRGARGTPQSWPRLGRVPCFRRRSMRGLRSQVRVAAGQGRELRLTYYTKDNGNAEGGRHLVVVARTRSSTGRWWGRVGRGRAGRGRG